jgi:predicted dehydrogenase
MNTIRWGILGCGGIANKFAESLKVTQGGELVACASNTPGKADDFAARHGVALSFSAYDALLAREEVDAVYVATTHNFHHDNVLQALDAGKHVMCEKPLGISKAEVQAMVDAARENELFLMEAMWSRFLPSLRHMNDLIQQGEIGEVRALRADFCFRSNVGPEHRLLNPDLAGGALWDVGIYPISTASLVFGGQQPVQVEAVADIGETGVDEQSSYLFRYANGALAMLSSSVRSPSQNRLEISGTKGMLVLPGTFHAARRMIKYQGREQVEEVEFDFDVSLAFQYEIDAAQEAIRAGKTECAYMSLDESLAIADTMDRILNKFQR